MKIRIVNTRSVTQKYSDMDSRKETSTAKYETCRPSVENDLTLARKIYRSLSGHPHLLNVSPDLILKLVGMSISVPWKYSFGDSRIRVNSFISKYLHEAVQTKEKTTQTLISLIRGDLRKSLAGSPDAIGRMNKLNDRYLICFDARYFMDSDTTMYSEKLKREIHIRSSQFRMDLLELLDPSPKNNKRACHRYFKPDTDEVTISEEILKTTNPSFEPIIDNITSVIRSLVLSHYESLGFEWNGYWGFFKNDHPLFLAWKGELPLTRENFRLCYDPMDTTISYHDPIKTKELAYTSTLESSRHWCGWTKKALKEAIFELNEYVPHTGGNERLPYPGFDVALPLTIGENTRYADAMECKKKLSTLSRLVGDILSNENLPEYCEEQLSNIYLSYRDSEIIPQGVYAKMNWGSDLSQGYYNAVYDSLISGRKMIV